MSIQQLVHPVMIEWAGSRSVDQLFDSAFSLKFWNYGDSACNTTGFGKKKNICLNINWIIVQIRKVERYQRGGGLII